MSSISDVAERFAADTATHEMTVLRDDGLYRHLRFIRMVTQKDGTVKPTSLYWFEVVTWPGSLAIHGDMDSYLFSRLDDMFMFFRGHEPNPGYWAEKIQAGKDPRRYSEERFAQLVREHIEDDDEEQYPGLRAAVEAEVIDSGELYHEHGARSVLEEFEFGATLTASCFCGTAAEGITPGDEIRWETGHRSMAPAGSGPHRVIWKHVDGYRFTDTWEWDFSDWTHHYLWACHAIPWAIARYDEAKTPAVTS